MRLEGHGECEGLGNIDWGFYPGDGTTGPMSTHSSPSPGSEVLLIKIDTEILCVFCQSCVEK